MDHNRRRPLLLLLLALSLVGGLFLLTTTDLNLDVSEALGLQRPGVYPVADDAGHIRFVSGRPYVAAYPVFALYLAAVAVLTILAIWRSR